mmetsp:Transcript_21736/g.38748  ORF Transcript_21736/g.38748 Transcript_21736/m.38748 type:complete len:299 (-) Transcript_21736:269-1165(-)
MSVPGEGEAAGQDEQQEDRDDGDDGQRHALYPHCVLLRLKDQLPRAADPTQRLGRREHVAVGCKLHMHGAEAFQSAGAHVGGQQQPLPPPNRLNGGEVEVVARRAARGVVGAVQRDVERRDERVAGGGGLVEREERPRGGGFALVIRRRRRGPKEAAGHIVGVGLQRRRFRVVSGRQQPHCGYRAALEHGCGGKADGVGQLAHCRLNLRVRGALDVGGAEFGQLPRQALPTRQRPHHRLQLRHAHAGVLRQHELHAGGHVREGGVERHQPGVVPGHDGAADETGQLESVKDEGLAERL